MALYATYQQYAELYGSELSETLFNHLIWAASKLLDRMTIGVDGFHKLKHAFPTDEDSAEAVWRCACALVDFAYSVEQAQNALGYVADADGYVTSRMIASKSSGSESVSYVTGGSSVKTAAVVAASDNEVRQQMQNDIIQQYLSGVKDANGVNLLYLGRYPRVHRYDNPV